MAAEQDIQIPQPPEGLLRSFYNQSVSNFITYLCKRVNEVNITKSSAINPHRRESVMGNIHRLVFTVLGRNFKVNERKVITQKNVEFNIHSLERIYEVFSKINLSRFHKTGDITIAAPWAYIKSDTTVDDIEIEQGSIVMVININNHTNLARVFLPCGGPDPETDNIQPWVKDVKVASLCRIDLDTIPSKKSVGISSKIKKRENWFIALKGQIEPGDVIKFNKEAVKVYTVATDFMSDHNNSIRIENEFKMDHCPQSFKIFKSPTIKGHIVSVSLDTCEMYRPVEIMLTGINKFEIGTASVAYYNFCFNEMGFMTHDTAISIDG